MRTYKLQIRVIQLAVMLTAILILAVWLGNTLVRQEESGALTPGLVHTTELENTKIVALGDSFTLGYPGTQKKSWPQIAAEQLQITIVNKGQAGQTAKDLLARLDQDVVSEDPGRVILFAGNGDVLQGVPLADFQNDMKQLIAKAEEQGIVTILAPPLPFPGYKQEIEEIRQWEQEYAEAQGILLLDFRLVLFNPDNTYLSGLSDDKKYPSTKGYKTMGDYAAQILK
ncbi:MAG: GDSL-type esterase/lipase family protein [Peptococcaceae bacterium]|jgi:lysophospholipase L1-like esterase|nr:GDSL-type esterase/lipase family protein [Peptococcaceae bacterium]